MRTPDIAYSYDNRFVVEQRCPYCRVLLRRIDLAVDPADFCSKSGKCGGCGKIVTLGQIFMYDRFSAIPFLTHDWATAAAATTLPWNQEDLVTEEDLIEFLDPESDI